MDKEAGPEAMVATAGEGAEARSTRGQPRKGPAQGDGRNTPSSSGPKGREAERRRQPVDPASTLGREEARTEGRRCRQ